MLLENTFSHFISSGQGDSSGSLDTKLGQGSALTGQERSVPTTTLLFLPPLTQSKSVKMVFNAI